jgi:AcrR family transcriptional regulator
MSIKEDQAKEEIAKVFQDFFKQYGFKKTSISDVAEYMKKSRRTIYNYFPGGKEEIYEYLIDQYAQSVLRRLNINLDPIKSYRAKFERLFDDMFRINKQIRTKEDFKSVVARDEIPAEGFRRAFKIKTQELLEEGIKKQEFRKLEISLTADIIYGIMRMALPYIYEKDSEKYEKETVTMIFHMILN